ncbi:MAG TPA: DUF4136 domain-containing protein [Chitinophagaceae bacterium]|nr:DUF4136 domain-containing protein [Chitinophagaceae bacterium]
MKKMFLPVMWVGMASWVLAGCTKEPVNHLTEEETRIYITNHDSTVSFSAFHTFSVADSVAVINDNQFVQRDQNAFDQAFLAALKTQLQARGFTLVDKTAKPDLGINVSRLYNNYTGLVSYTDYYGDYYGYWDPYYWGYPGYSYYFPTYYGVYNITQGGLSVDMFDLKDASGTNQLKYVWNGLVRGEGLFNPANASQEAQALLSQSAYLKTN